MVHAVLWLNMQYINAVFVINVIAEQFMFKVSLRIVGQWLFIVNRIIKETFNAMEMYDVIITNIMYWNKNIYLEIDYWYATEFASFFRCCNNITLMSIFQVVLRRKWVF